MIQLECYGIKQAKMSHATFFFSEQQQKHIENSKFISSSLPHEGVPEVLLFSTASVRIVVVEMMRK